MPRYAEATGGVGEGGNKVEPTAATGIWEIPDTLTGVRGSAFPSFDRGIVATDVAWATSAISGRHRCQTVY